MTPVEDVSLPTEGHTHKVDKYRGKLVDVIMKHSKNR